MPAAKKPTTYVALIPGINVGGNRKVPMAVLRASFEEAGATAVTTYIQSGNVVFRSTTPVATLGPALEASATEGCGMAISVVLRTLAELQAVVAANPFTDRTDDLTKLHVIFLDRAAKGSVPDVDVDSFAPEELAYGKQELYLHLPNGMGRAKLPVALMKKSKARPPMTATAGNWRTTLKLLELAEGA